MLYEQTTPPVVMCCVLLYNKRVCSFVF